jgi:hypothetical protein
VDGEVKMDQTTGATILISPQKKKERRKKSLEV